MNPKNIKTDLIVIKRINYKDADKILTVYTKDFGKLEVLAKGVRKLNSKKRSHLELLSHSHSMLVKGKKFWIITQTETIHNYTQIRKDYKKTLMAYMMIEIFNKLVPEEDANSNLFNFIDATLLSHSQNTYSTNLLEINFLNAYMTKLFKILGFFSTSNVKNHEMKNYFEFLIKTKYAEINHSFINQFNEKSSDKLNEIVKSTYEFLIFQIEEITERNLKSKYYPQEIESN